MVRGSFRYSYSCARATFILKVMFQFGNDVSTPSIKFFMNLSTTIIFIIFWDFLIFYQIFLSPQVKRCAIITGKHGIYGLDHELPNDLRLIRNVPKLHRKTAKPPVAHRHSPDNAIAHEYMNPPQQSYSIDYRRSCKIITAKYFYARQKIGGNTTNI